MNWFKILKFAQIWGTNWVFDNIESQLEAFYELEYKYSMLKLHPFSGHPKRKENILNNLRNNLSEVGSEIKIMLSGVFGNWLQSHALLNPIQWAEERIGKLEGEHLEVLLSEVLYEYVEFA